MGEQVIFDNSLIRTVQSRSCDQCFVHKSKCSRHTPCHACATHARACTYERQSQYRRRPQPIANRRAQLVEHSSAPARVRTQGTNRDHVQRPVLISSSETSLVNAVALEVPGQTFDDALATLNESLDSGSFDWMNLNLPTDMEFPDDIDRLMEVPSSLDNSNQLPNRIPSCPSDVQTLGDSTVQTRQLARPTISESIWRMINLFLDRLHPSMPFFRRSYLVDNIYAKRYLHDRPFNALIHAISALTIFQMLQKGSGRLRSSDQIGKAEFLLAEAVRLHSHKDLGEQPVLEHVLTSVFLFGCQFCKGNHHTARLRLREAVTLAETMGLDDPHTYGNITRDERDRRLRTFLCLTVIHRVYALQRDCPVNDYLLTSRRLNRVQNMVKQDTSTGDQPEARVIRGLGHMVDLIDFVDSTFVRCWRNQCWAEANPTHISPAAISALLQRYTAPILMRDSPNEAQRADVLITRHWICHILWDLGLRHGFMHEERLAIQMRPDYALRIAHDTIETCESFDTATLECHGVGLVSNRSSRMHFKVA
ncbi:hypothetical protein BCR34DRAFT_151613 [Clohesyomyces aquaticus]|uniref:Zn(2)-C6 fungal-type domain-containing protein n=1 Tax=Clohesyomyces aquaticus TaxID=1231657 RepID=A0A1Y1YJW5_9PLEO|nr:hypothetical protein BCR34DRAFT_151613 [Clohesyomyces aquaticus]